MNKDLTDLVEYYATKSHAELGQFLHSKSKDNLIAVLIDLLTAYINDKNSSSLREFITVAIAGYEHNSNKLGYNGYKHSSDIGGKSINCEAKPMNIQTAGYEEKKTKLKLNGSGGFNDYTYERLIKDEKENLNMLCSGFVDGQLHYILEFPFLAISDRLRKQVPEHRETGTYTRYANFNFSHYSDCQSVKLIYIDKQAIELNKKYFQKQFYEYLIKILE